MPAQFIVYEASGVDARRFVEFWAPYYDASDELYDRNIHGKWSENSVIDLFVWKNGGKLSEAKRRSVEQNYINRIGDAKRHASDATEFLRQFPQGGAIWRIFWLHCCNPDYPIYDQHVHRAMNVLDARKLDELDDYTDEQKIDSYLKGYLGFHRQFAGIDGRQVDRALWAFGKFSKKWRFPDRGVAGAGA